MYSRWHEIVDDEIYRVEISVAFAKPLGKEPDPEKRGGEVRLHKHTEQQEQRVNLLNKQNELLVTYDQVAKRGEVILMIFHIISDRINVYLK